MQKLCLKHSITNVGLKQTSHIIVIKVKLLDFYHKKFIIYIIPAQLEYMKQVGGGGGRLLLISFSKSFLKFNMLIMNCSLLQGSQNDECVQQETQKEGEGAGFVFFSFIYATYVSKQVLSSFNFSLEIVLCTIVKKSGTYSGLKKDYILSRNIFSCC